MKRDFKYLRTYIKRVVSDEDALISDNHLYDDIIDTYNDEVKKVY
jgi:phage repressor protein C with HTH and peptisase S24 domain